MKMQNLFVELGTYLKKKRIKSGLSQSQVSKELGYTSPQFISNFERGLCAPPMNKLKILVDLYSIPVRELTSLLLREQKKYIEYYFGNSAQGKARKRA